MIIENTNDIPYVKSSHVGPEITATVARVCTEVRNQYPKIPLGLQILAAANEESLAGKCVPHEKTYLRMGFTVTVLVANACGLNFIRVESFVFGSIADEGFMDACAGSLLRMRKRIGAENILVFADIKKKHR